MRNGGTGEVGEVMITKWNSGSWEDVNPAIQDLLMLRLFTRALRIGGYNNDAFVRLGKYAEHQLCIPASLRISSAFRG